MMGEKEVQIMGELLLKKRENFAKILWSGIRMMRVCMLVIDLTDANPQALTCREHLRFSIGGCLGMEPVALRNVIRAMQVRAFWLARISVLSFFTGNRPKI